MPTIGDLSHGTSTTGVSEFLKEIESKLVGTVATNAEDIAGLESACNENWEGKSKERFLENLKSDVKLLRDSLNQMYEALEVEIYAAANAIIDFDKNLIEN